MVPEVWLAPEEGEVRLLATFSQVLWLMYIQGGSKYHKRETGSNTQCNNITKLRSFLGLLAALSSFIPNLSELARVTW